MLIETLTSQLKGNLEPFLSVHTHRQPDKKRKKKHHWKEDLKEDLSTKINDNVKGYITTRNEIRSYTNKDPTDTQNKMVVNGFFEKGPWRK